MSFTAGQGHDAMYPSTQSSDHFLQNERLQQSDAIPPIVSAAFVRRHEFTFGVCPLERETYRCMHGIWNVST